MVIGAAVGCGAPTDKAHHGSIDVTSAKPRSASDPVSASLQPARASVQPGETFELAVVLEVGAFYEIHPLAAQPPDIPTTLTLGLPAGFQGEGNWSEPPTVRSERPAAGGAHAGRVRFTRKVTVAGDITPGAYVVTCDVCYQACDARQCLAPVSFTLSASVAVEPRE